MLKKKRLWLAGAAVISSTSALAYYNGSKNDKSLDDIILNEKGVEKLGVIDEGLTMITITFLGMLSKFIMQVLNTTEILNNENLNVGLLRRAKDQGLITVSNHVSAVDDPGVVAALLPPSSFLNVANMRWTLCAKDRCFRNHIMSQIFHYGKVLPIERGRGIYQTGMTNVIKRLNIGQWIHMFPGGSRNASGEIGKVRNGVARLIVEPNVTPVVIPIYHSGMQQILARGEFIPISFNKKLKIIVGQEIKFDDLISSYNKKEISEDDLYLKITNRIELTLNQLKNEIAE